MNIHDSPLIPRIETVSMDTAPIFGGKRFTVTTVTRW